MNSTQNNLTQSEAQQELEAVAERLAVLVASLPISDEVKNHLAQTLSEANPEDIFIAYERLQNAFLDAVTQEIDETLESKVKAIALDTATKINDLESETVKKIDLLSQQVISQTAINKVI